LPAFITILLSNKERLTMIPGDDAWMISGLKFFTSLYIRGLNASDIGTALYQGRPKLLTKRDTEIVKDS
jgi:hypothetical protein